MSSLSNAQAALKLAAVSTMGPGVAAASARAKASMIVAQAGAIAVQDATDYLRSVSTICSTATGLAIALALADQDTIATNVLKHVSTIMPEATAHFGATGTAASQVVSTFPTS